MFSATGNLSLNSSSDAGYKLDVNGTSRFSGTVQMGTSTSSSGLSIYSNQTALTIYGSTGYARAFTAFTWDITPDIGIMVGNTLGFNTNATIGTNVGTRALTIASTGAATFRGDFTSYGTFGSFGQLHIAGATDSNKKLVFGYNTSANVGFIQAMQNGTAYSPLLLNSTGGNVLIGTTTDGGYKLDVNGTARVSGVVTLSNLAGTGSRAVLADASGVLSAPVSDISVKQNITSIGYGLKEISKMNPVWFDFIDEYKNYGEGRQNGNIAQEMAEIIPEAVFTTPSTGKMGINYDQLHAVYIKAIQELKAEIEELKLKIK
jgi:hypothetical protein